MLKSVTLLVCSSRFCSTSAEHQRFIYEFINYLCASLNSWTNKDHRIDCNSINIYSDLFCVVNVNVNVIVSHSAVFRYSALRLIHPISA